MSNSDFSFLLDGAPVWCQRQDSGPEQLRDIKPVLRHLGLEKAIDALDEILGPLAGLSADDVQKSECPYMEYFTSQDVKGLAGEGDVRKQLMMARSVANRLGCYDAADVISSRLQ